MTSPHTSVHPDLTIQPISLSTANTLVHLWHRHSRQAHAHQWSLGLFATDFTLHGAVIIARPVARHLDDGHTVEIVRLVTDGTRNACSMLSGAACRQAHARGYRTVITYTLESETGASLRAAGFVAVAAVRADQWNRPSRPRRSQPARRRVRWERQR